MIFLDLCQLPPPAIFCPYVLILLFSLARHSTCPVCRQRLGNDGADGEPEQDGGEGDDGGDDLDMSIDE